MLSFPSWAGFAGVFQNSGISSFSWARRLSSLRMWLLTVSGYQPSSWPHSLYRPLELISSQNPDGDFVWALQSCRTEGFGLWKVRLDDNMPHITHHTASHDIVSKLCEAWGGLLLCSRCSGMGPSLSLLRSPLLLQAVDAAHKLKEKDMENICIRTSSTIPGKYQTNSGGPVWLRSVLHSYFPQGFLPSSLVTQTSPSLGVVYVLLPSPFSSAFLFSSPSSPEHLPDRPMLGTVEARYFSNSISRISLSWRCCLSPCSLISKKSPFQRSFSGAVLTTPCASTSSCSFWPFLSFPSSCFRRSRWKGWKQPMCPCSNLAWCDVLKLLLQQTVWPRGVQRGMVVHTQLWIPGKDKIPQEEQVHCQTLHSYTWGLWAAVRNSCFCAPYNYCSFTNT